MKAKEFIPQSKPRNFVAKNSKTAGAGAHKDKKRAEKQGDVKHKNKQFEQGVAEGAGMGDHRYEVKHKDVETGEVKSSKVRAMSPKEARREVENHYSHSSSRWKHIDTRKIDEGVAEGSGQQFDMGLAKILKQRGYKGPVKLEQLGMKWVEAIGDIVDIDDLIMVQGTDPEYDGWVSYVFGLGKYAYGAEQGYTTGTAKRVEIDTKHEQGVAERVRDPEDWDEGNTEPPNNFAVYINGKKWKVFKGRGQFADDYKEMQHFRQLQTWAQQKSTQTGKKWEVYKTGEAPTA